ncbi:Holliday junction resolvase RuvX [Patescibacteria group bacterium]
MKLLSIDYGTKRIGLAIGDTADNVVVPYGMIENEGKKSSVVAAIEKVCEEEEIDKIIVGIPFQKEMDSKQAKITQTFVDFLKNSIILDIDIYDETFSTKMAEQNDIYRDLYKDREQGWKDAVAAGEILRGYMESLK